MVTLAARWKLERFPDESVLLDLAGGAYFVLNGSAARIAGALVSGRTAAEVAAELARDFGLALETATRDVAAVEQELRAPAEDRTRGPVWFVADGDRFEMFAHGQSMARVAADGSAVEPTDTESALELRQRLLAVAPHLLVLQGGTVLHASSVISSRGAHAFSGASGAGKTTLAHAAARHGAHLASEDLCIVTLDGGAAKVVLEGEAHVRGWVERSARAFERGLRTVDARELADLSALETRRLAEITFLDPDRRGTHALTFDRTPPGAGLVSLLANAFAELDRRDVWRRVFEGSAELARSVAISHANVPAGLDELDREVGAWALRGFSTA